MIRAVMLLAFLALPLSGVAADKFPAPFGLEWGASQASLVKLGFANSSNDGGFVTLRSASVPKAWSKAQAYLAVLYKNQLVKVVAISENFKDDVAGAEGKEAYEHLKDILTKKYGQPSNHTERTGGKLYDGYDEFYQCLDYSGCGFYYTIYKYDGGVVGLQLKGLRRGEGFLVVEYESPDFSVAKAAIKRGDSAADADAL